MNRLVFVAAGIGALVACEGGGSSGNARLAPTFTGSSPLALATQVGSEGYWGCPVEGTTPIADPTVAIDGFGIPTERAAEVLGVWALTLVPVDATAGEAGAFSATPQGYLWVDVTDGEDCEDHVVVGVVGALTRADTYPLAGAVGLRPDRASLVAGNVEPLVVYTAEWGEPERPELTAFRVEGELAADTLTGEVSYAACEVTAITCDDRQPLADLDGVR